jgi:hypothetical protein
MRALEFEAGGAAHALRFDVNALCRVEELSGLGIADAAKLLSPETGVARIADMRMFFQAGLVARLSADDAGTLMGEVGIERALELVVQAFDLAFGKGSADKRDATGGGEGKRAAAAG